MSDKKTYPISCNKDCGAGCALTAIVEDGKIEKIIDSPERLTYMKGCLKGYRTGETIYHEKRILKPLIRTGERGSKEFREASWDEALDLIADKLHYLRSADNCSGLMRIGGSGACRGALHNTDYVAKRFMALFGAYTDTKGNFSSEASDFVKQPIFGTANIGVDAKTLLKSDHIILWGFNPFDTRFGCDTELVLKEATDKGIPITVIDPRKTRTVQNLKAKWLPVKPGTDSALMFALLWTLISENLIQRDYINKYSTGFDLLEQYILGISDGVEKSPLWAEKICGLSAEEIIDFTHAYASAPTAALLPGLSLQRAIGGENTDRLGAVLQLATANIGKMGGSSGSSKWNKLGKPRFGKLPVPVNDSVYKVPVYSWADAVLEGKKGGYPTDISFLYNVGGNYIGQGSDTDKNIRAFEKIDFAVTHDYFMTATASYSDVVLPVTTFAEREDIISATGNFIFYSARAIDPVGHAKNDFWIFTRLAQRLGFQELSDENKSESQWIDSILSDSEIKDIPGFKEKGFYAGMEQERIGLSDFISDPHKYPLYTQSGKIEIASGFFRSLGGTLLPEHIVIETTDKFPLRMISPHEKYRIHSQNDNIPSLKRLCDDRLWMNPADADKRKIKNEDQVTVFNEIGEIGTVAFITDKIAEGTLSLTQGSWDNNINYLSSTIPAKPSNGARTHSIIVNVK